MQFACFQSATHHTTAFKRSYRLPYLLEDHAIPFFWFYDAPHCCLALRFHGVHPSDPAFAIACADHALKMAAHHISAQSEPMSNLNARLIPESPFCQDRTQASVYVTAVPWTRCSPSTTLCIQQMAAHLHHQVELE